MHFPMIYDQQSLTILGWLQLCGGMRMSMRVDLVCTWILSSRIPPSH